MLVWCFNLVPSFTYLLLSPSIGEWFTRWPPKNFQQLEIQVGFSIINMKRRSNMSSYLTCMQSFRGRKIGCIATIGWSYWEPKNILVVDRSAKIKIIRRKAQGVKGVAKEDDASTSHYPRNQPYYKLSCNLRNLNSREKIAGQLSNNKRRIGTKVFSRICSCSNCNSTFLAFDVLLWMFCSFVSLSLSLAHNIDKYISAS